jgi:hypothetical protein
MKIANKDAQEVSIPLKSHLNHFFSGAFAGICAVLVTNPLDVARTRLQLLEVRNDADKSRLRNGFFNLVREVYQREGIRGLYKGAKPRIYISIPGSALAFVGYEALKDYSIKRD